MVLARASLNLRITSALERPCGRIDLGDAALWLRSSKALSQLSLACGALPPIRIWRGRYRALHGAKQTTLCQQDMLGGFADGPAVRPRLPGPLRFAHVLHIGEILFLGILEQFDKMRSLFSGPLNAFSENRNGFVLHSISPFQLFFSPDKSVSTESFPHQTRLGAALM